MTVIATNISKLSKYFVTQSYRACSKLMPPFPELAKKWFTRLKKAPSTKSRKKTLEENASQQMNSYQNETTTALPILSLIALKNRKRQSPCPKKLTQ